LAPTRILTGFISSLRPLPGALFGDFGEGNCFDSYRNDDKSLEVLRKSTISDIRTFLRSGEVEWQLYEGWKVVVTVSSYS